MKMKKKKEKKKYGNRSKSRGRYKYPEQFLRKCWKCGKPGHMKKDCGSHKILRKVRDFMMLLK